MKIQSNNQRQPAFIIQFTSFSLMSLIGFHSGIKFGWFQIESVLAQWINLNQLQQTNPGIEKPNQT